MPTKLVKHSFTREMFLAIPDEELQFFLISSRLLNELSILIRYVAWTSQYPYKEFESSPYDDAGFAQKMAAVYSLIGKIHSGWEILKKRFIDRPYSKPYLDDMEANNQKAVESLGKIKTYFSNKDSSLNIVRHNVASHSYDQKNITLDGFRRNDFGDIVIYLADDSIANCLFHGSDMNAILSVTSIIDPNFETAFGVLENEAASMQDHLAKVFYGIYRVFSGRHLVKDHKQEAIEVASPIEFDKIFLPYFIEPPKGLVLKKEKI